MAGAAVVVAAVVAVVAAVAAVVVAGAAVVVAAGAGVPQDASINAASIRAIVDNMRCFIFKTSWKLFIEKLWAIPPAVI